MCLQHFLRGYPLFSSLLPIEQRRFLCNLAYFVCDSDCIIRTNTAESKPTDDYLVREQGIWIMIFGDSSHSHPHSHPRPHPHPQDEKKPTNKNVYTWFMIKKMKKRNILHGMSIEIRSRFVYGFVEDIQKEGIKHTKNKYNILICQWLRTWKRLYTRPFAATDLWIRFQTWSSKVLIVIYLISIHTS